MSRYQSVTGAHWFPVTPTLSEWRGGYWEVLGGEDLELDAFIYWLEANGEVQLSVANLEGISICISICVPQNRKSHFKPILTFKVKIFLR